MSLNINPIQKEFWSYQARTLPSLDGIRGFAFLLVLAAHISNANDLFFVGAGKIGVWLFFVLSSFLLTNYFISKPERIFSLYEWLNYVVRRVMRIIPLYYFIILLYFSFRYLVQDFQTVLNNMLLIEGTGHFWTIPVEMKYYLFLPIVVFVLIHVLKLNQLLSVGFAIFFVLINQFFYPSDEIQGDNIVLMNYISVFVMGSVAAVLNLHMNKIKFSNKLQILFDVIAFLLLISIILTFPKVWSFLFYPVESNFFYQDFIFYGFAFSIIILTMVHGKGYFRKIFEIKFLAYCGLISYSGYLLHPLLIAIERNIFSYETSVHGVLFIVGATLVGATFLYRWIEVPSIKIKLKKRTLVLQDNKMSSKR